MINDTQMLQFIMKNAEMGCRGINDIKHYSNTAKMARELRSQNLEYGHIYHSAHSMLHSIGGESKHIHPVVATMARAKAKREMRAEDSDSHIAEMMIKGNTMGVNKIAQRMRQYNGANKEVANLANRLMETQQNNIESMKGFL
ncbi:MAG: DUF305 domain-containing protein [Ruminococcus sp.]|nr:DUF305 domain-containing protein [Ruminococcus sp.]